MINIILRQKDTSLSERKIDYWATGECQCRLCLTIVSTQRLQMNISVYIEQIREHSIGQ